MVKRTIGIAVWLLMMVGCKASPSVTKEDAAPPAPEAKAAPPAPPPQETISDKVAKLPTMAAAIAAATPQMDDSINEISDEGTLVLARWSAKKLRWVDVSVAKNEVSFASVLKDSEEARGKRLCASGSIIEIEVVKTPDGKLFDGLLQDYNGSLYKFEAAGSSGDLVAQSQARLCGFVTGKYDYSNSAGGTGHAIKVVGMFDLPENTKAKP